MESKTHIGQSVAFWLSPPQVGGGTVPGLGTEPIIRSESRPGRPEAKGGVTVPFSVDNAS